MSVYTTSTTVLSKAILAPRIMVIIRQDKTYYFETMDNARFSMTSAPGGFAHSPGLMLLRSRFVYFIKKLAPSGD
jgi:hypothetical protein